MTFTKYSNGEIDRVGKALVENESLDAPRKILNEWRAQHAYPINTFQATLRDKLNRLGLAKSSFVAQRLKRAPTIIDKLRRYPEMKLSRMQDIGGLRAVVESVEAVYRLVEEYKHSRFHHRLIREKNYIQSPRTEDGYRSYHLVYDYKNSKSPQYGGLALELQIRTKLQHAWATAVETMGLYLDQPLKSRRGDPEWLDFFAITSSAFAHSEGSPLVPRFKHLNKTETYKAVKESESKLDVLNKLAGFALAANVIHENKPRGYYQLIILNTSQRTVALRGFPESDFEIAKRAYAEVEELAALGEKLEPVLVSVGSVGTLQRAFPSFFLDTREFVKNVRNIINSIT